MDGNRLFRKLTVENWRIPNETASHIVRIGECGSAEHLNEDDWAAIILEYELSPRVPEDVRNLFEVAQGVLCYGCFFYPLYTLGSEQIYRVLEAALLHRCRQLNARPNVRTFHQAIEWMKVKGSFSEARYHQWSGARSLRNIASHADRQSLVDPITAVRSVDIAHDLINDLFDDC